MNFYQPASLFRVETPDTARLIAMLLATRAATQGAGNRRTLYSSMDDLLASVPGDVGDGGPIGGDALEVTPPVAAGESVRLTRLRLRNWKSFEAADLVIPAGSDDRPLIVVGGPNGFGKSSLLEAFCFGLFGRRAISDMGLLASGAGRGGHRRSYRAILERSLHRSARAAGEGTCSVSLEFTTSAGPVLVERRWYFEEGGALIEDDEELLVRCGEERSLLRPPAGVVTREWQQAEVERLIMPAGLAPFFVFDGEQIERRADRQLTEQVHAALSRLLGLEDLAGLASDLRDYARDRERGISDSDAIAIEGIRQEVGELALQLTDAEREADVAAATLEHIRTERDDVLAALSAVTTGSHSSMQDLLESEHRLQSEGRQLARDMAAAICEDGPFLLAGADLVARAIASVQGVGANADGLELDDDEADLLWSRFVQAGPPLPPETTEDLRARFKRACGGAGVKPDRVGPRIRLDRTSRQAVVARLRAVLDGGRTRVEATTAAVAANREALERLARNTTEHERASRTRVQAQADLSAIAGRIHSAEDKSASAVAKVTTLRAALGAKSHQLQTMDEAVRGSEPRRRTAAAARGLAAKLDAHASAIADAEHARFAAAVTRSFRELSHKDQISRIDISPDGSVVLTDAEGRDMSGYPLSAGESQLFAMALVAAVGELAGDRLPLVVDTPLARLDTLHRRSVLRMLSRRQAQTIVLTQPEEVSAADMVALASRIAMSAQLHHEIDPSTGVGVSRIVADAREETQP